MPGLLAWRQRTRADVRQAAVEDFQAAMGVSFGLLRVRVLMKTGKLLWSEDDARPPDAERLEAAYLRIVGDIYRSTDAIESEDCGDGTMLLMPTVIVWSSYPSNSAIYEKP